MVWALDLPCFLDFNQPEWVNQRPPQPPPTKSSWRVLMDGHLLLAHPPRCLEWFFFGTILFEGASHFYSSWRELWGRRHLFGSIWWRQLSVAFRLLCGGAGASHLPSGYSGNLHEVFRWCPWCQRGTTTESWGRVHIGELTVPVLVWTWPSAWSFNETWHQVPFIDLLENRRWTCATYRILQICSEIN